MEEERIKKFKDLILNEHYCDDCNNLCGIGETFPLEFVAKYIIKLEKENQKLKQQNKEYKINTISKNKIRNKIEQLECFLYTGKNAPQDFVQYRIKAKIQALQELMED